MEPIQHDEIIFIDHITFNASPTVGSDDAFFNLRIVPDGREGKVVFARTLRSDEYDIGTKVEINRTLGETLQFRSGSIEVTFGDIDRTSQLDPDGYAPIAIYLYIWLTIGMPTSPDFFRYLFATARRLDGAKYLHGQIHSVLVGSRPPFRSLMLGASLGLSLSEIFMVALGRTVDMLDKLKGHFSVSAALPTVIEAKKLDIKKIRDAIEHIEDRAFGQVREKPHPEALSIFDQTRFLSDGILQYGSHSLSLTTEVPVICVAARRYIFDAAAEIAGSARKLVPPINFFNA